MSLLRRSALVPFLVLNVVACGGEAEEHPAVATLVAPSDGATQDTPAPTAAPAGAIDDPVQPAKAKPKPASASSRLVLKLQMLQDKGMGGMESHSVLVPDGWTATGGAWWAPQQLFAILPSQEVRVESPEGHFVLVGPSFGATDFEPSQYSRQFGATRPPEGSVDSGYPVIYMPGSVPAWKTWLQDKILPAEYPDARKIRITDGVVVPELTEILKRQMEPLRREQAMQNQQWGDMGGGRSFGDEAVLAFEWSFEKQGKPFDALLVFSHVYTGFESQAGRQTSWTIEPSVTFCAPKGKLEESMPLLIAISNSVQPTPQWAKMKSDHIRAMNNIAAKGAADRAQIAAKASRDVSDILHDGWRARNASSDASHAKYVNSILEVQNYSTPGSDTSVQLPSGYGHVFSNGNGEYLLTDDALFNPNTDSAFNAGNWSAMNSSE